MTHSYVWLVASVGGGDGRGLKGISRDGAQGTTRVEENLVWKVTS